MEDYDHNHFIDKIDQLNKDQTLIMRLERQTVDNVYTIMVYTTDDIPVPVYGPFDVRVLFPIAISRELGADELQKMVYYGSEENSRLTTLPERLFDLLGDKAEQSVRATISRKEYVVSRSKQ